LADADYLTLIEIVALWEGRLTTTTFAAPSGSGRPTGLGATSTLQPGRRAGNLVYDARALAATWPAPGFVPRVTAGVADEYLQLLNRNRDLALRFESLGLQSANTEVLALPQRSLRPDILRPLLEGRARGSAGRGGIPELSARRSPRSA